MIRISTTPRKTANVVTQPPTVLPTDIAGDTSVSGRTLEDQPVKDPENMTGPELIKYIAQFPTIDHYLDRDPFAKPLTDAELILLTRTQRAERSLFNVKEQKRKDKKAGVPTDETGESDDGTSD